MSNGEVKRTEASPALSHSALWSLIVLLVAVPLFGASPSLGRIMPRGVQRGAESDLFFNGARLGDAQEILFYAPGFEVVKLEVVKPNQVKVRVKVAPNCRLGEHAARVRTKSGVSDLRTFYVGALPSVDEKEPNSDFAAPQKIRLGVTVGGVVQNEDVDYYQFEAKKGQRVVAEVEGMRLGTRVFDPYVAILNAKRFELAASDDHPLLRQDSVAGAMIPEDGTYFVEVRESSYSGAGDCFYRLHLGTFPRPTAVYPAGGKLGDEVEVRFIGDAAGDFSRKIKLDGPLPGGGLFPRDDGGIAPSPNPFRVSEYPNHMEKEPNDARKQASPATVPGAFNGIIEKPGDTDWFRFAAKKGQTFDVHVYARRIRTPLDPVMNVYHAGGGEIAGNDDSGGPDSYFRFTAPADKEYELRIRDHLRKGGRDYVYRVEVTPVRPRVSVTIPRVARYSQERQVVVVPRGNRYSTLMSASRSDFGGDLVIEPAGLPPGLKMSCETMPGNLNAIPVLFEAAADAPVGGGYFNLRVRHADPKRNIAGIFAHTMDMSRGPPGNSIYWRYRADKLAVAVAEEVPFKIKIVEPKAPLVRGGAMDLKVAAERKDGFNGAIAIQMAFNPPGVGASRGRQIAAGKNEAVIRLDANGGAQIREWKITVLGRADVGGPVWVASQLATLRVAAPFIDLAMEKNSVEQGKATDLFCKVTTNAPFQGKAKLTVLGLPARVTAPPIEIDKDTKEVTFKVAADAKSPAGRHRNIFCRVELVHEGEPVVHSAGGTELRIDKPLPPPKKKPKPQPKPKQVAKAPPKPAPKKPPRRLTRLEKLRLKFKDEQEAQQDQPEEKP